MACTAESWNWQFSAFYREAVESVVHFNGQLMRERRARLPFVDVQTGLAQSDCHLTRSRLERRRGVLPGQVYSYPLRRWRRESRPLDARPPKLSVQPDAATVSSTSGLIQTVEGGVVTKRSSRIAGLSRREPDYLLMPVGVRVPLASPVSSSLCDEDESPEADVDYLEEYDSDEERKQKKKKKLPPKVKPSNSSQRLTRDQEKERPYLCTHCGRRYKTSPSLKAHCTQYHAGEGAGPSLTPSPSHSSPAPAPPPAKLAEEKVPIQLPPPPNMVGRGCHKPNPYCDFCLGDDTGNRKSGKAERMVSCADCGRSAHPTCMQFSGHLAAVVRTYRWQCIECKSCHLCGTSENDDQLLFCDDCDRGYHMYCLKPPIKEPPEGSWSCGRCLRPLSEVKGQGFTIIPSLAG